jgi:two-component system phosphate regulon response regulator OmpR
MVPTSEPAAATPVLIVDDEPELRGLLAEYFGRYGFAVRAASGAAEARALIAEQRPALAMLDINMPGISGWEFLDELKKLGRFVNVYMYSSSIDPEDVKRARAYPMVREFLSKPLDMKTIHQLLDMPELRKKVS